MLAIERYVGQEVVLVVPGEKTADGKPLELRITLARVRFGRAKLTFEGPMSFVIWRREIHDAKQAANQVPTVSLSP
jgi:sRNA-binding carbon storage regulator CsrA